MRWAGNVARVGDRRFVYGVLASKHQCKGPLGIRSSRGEDNTNMHLKVTGWSVDWINPAQNSDKRPDFMKKVMKHRFAENKVNTLTS